jgi:hypothetical protein
MMEVLIDAWLIVGVTLSVVFMWFTRGPLYATDILFVTFLVMAVSGLLVFFFSTYVPSFCFCSSWLHTTKYADAERNIKVVVERVSRL